MAVVQSDTLNVRGGPGSTHPIIGTAKQGDNLPVSGRNQDGAWLEVTIPGGQKGWVSASLVHWRPKRWIITDGSKDVVNGLSWEWVSLRTGRYEQPTIQLGQSAGWTFIAFPVDRNQWVKAVEFVWNGQTYRGEFDLGTFHNNYNYKDCGEPRQHTDRPTPTPRP